MAECSVKIYEYGYEAGYCKIGTCNMSISACHDLNQTVCSGFCVDEKCHYEREVSGRGKKIEAGEWKIITYCRNSSKSCNPKSCAGCSKGSYSCEKDCSLTCRLEQQTEAMEVSVIIIMVSIVIVAVITLFYFILCLKKNKKRQTDE